MTKKQSRSEKRLAPVGLEGIERIKKVCEDKRYGKVNEVMVDLFSASAIVAVYDAVNDDNKLKLQGMCVGRLADVCFKLINNQTGGGR